MAVSILSSYKTLVIDNFEESPTADDISESIAETETGEPKQ